MGVNDVVICEPLRTPVGRFGGALSSLTAADLAAHGPDRTGAPHRARRGRRRRRRARPGLPQRRVAGDRPDRRTGRGTRDRGARRPDRPPLRIRAAGRAVRRRPGRNRRGEARRGRRGRVDVAGRALRARAAHRRPRRQRGAGGPARPGSGHRGRQEPPGPRRHAGDRREPPARSTASAARSRTSSPSAPTSAPVAAHEAGRFADELVPVTVPGGAASPTSWSTATSTRAPEPPSRTSPAAAGAGRSRTPSPPSPPATPAGRTTAPPCAWSPPARRPSGAVSGRCSRLKSWAVAGVGPEAMGIGPVPATAAALDARRPHPRRHGPDRAQRGVRRPGARRACGSGRSTPTDERLNPNGSGISLGHPVGATGARILATLAHEMQRRESPLRPGDHVHRRRPGHGRGLRAVRHEPRQAGPHRRRGGRRHPQRRQPRRRRLRPGRHPVVPHRGAARARRRRPHGRLQQLRRRRRRPRPAPGAAAGSAA